MEYGSEASLEFIGSQGHDIAAVLVEPVQSRHPELQPGNFLTALRKITREAGTILIFDEMITGFRIHPGGAQQWFGVEADMATYGKIVGGGLPIGVVAGRSGFMDGIDGGVWEYGDDSYPQTDTTFFAGTFGKHPLTMASAKAVLEAIKQQGPSLQEGLNNKTAALVNRLNCHFGERQVPIKMVNFGSLFRFVFTGNLDLLFYHLLENGLYIWEGRNCFLSTAHSQDDIDNIYQIIVHSVGKLQGGGFFGGGGPLSETVTESDKKESVAGLIEAQQQLWAANNIDAKAGYAYHLTLTVELRGLVNTDLLNRALVNVIRRHPALGTVFNEEGSVQSYSTQSCSTQSYSTQNCSTQNCSTQNYSEPIDEELLKIIDFSLLSNKEKEFRVNEFFSGESARHFDLEKELLFRVSLIKLDENKYLLSLRSHHIVSDGLSLNIVLQDLAAIYSGLSQEGGDPLPPAMGFHEYVEHYFSFQQSPSFKQQERYWLDQLSGENPVLSLPADKVATEKSYEGARYHTSVPASLVARSQRMARQHGCTLFIGLFSVYALWLHRLSGQREIIVGFPVSGRGMGIQEDKVDHLVGYCTHLLPVVSRLNEQETFAEFVAGIKETLLEAYENQDYPFSQLIKKLNVKQDVRQAPLLSTVFNLDTINNAPAFDELESVYHSDPVSFVDFDLSFNFVADQTVEGSGLHLTLECDYRTDLFAEETIDRWIKHFYTLLKDGHKNPQKRAVELSLLDEEERNALLLDHNKTDVGKIGCKTFKTLFESQIKKVEDRTAIIFKSDSVDYAELNHRANQLAHYLKQQGIKREQRVAIYLSTSIEQVIAVLAVIKSGAAYVPIDGSLTSQRVHFMVSDSQSELLITQQDLLSSLGECRIATLCMDADKDKLRHLPASHLSVSIKGKDLAYIIYTSGSTGKPKGVMVEHECLVNRLQGWQDALSLNTMVDPVHLQMASFSFDVFTGDFIRALGSGASLVLADKDDLLDSEQLYNLIKQHQVTCAEFVPAVILSLCDFIEGNNLLLESLQLLMVGSDTWYNKDSWRVKALTGGHVRVMNTYGVTEATIDSAFYEVPDINACNHKISLQCQSAAIVPIGKPMSNVRLYILDNCLEPLPIGVSGELCIGGDSIARGYHGLSALTDKRFIRDPFSSNDNARLYKTGDYARLNNKGEIEFLGRMDDQVKIRGHRVELGEVESQLKAFDNIDNCVALAKPDAKGKNQLIAYITSTAVVDTVILRESLQSCLPDYMIPSAYVTLDAFPLTANGKLDKKALRKMKVRFELQSSFVAAQSDNEKILTELYKDLFTRDVPGIHDNFFELGGDSITAIQLVSRMRQAGLSCKVADIFSYQTIHSLALHVEHIDSSMVAEDTAATPDIPLNPIQSWCYEQQLENLNHWNQALLLGCDKLIDTHHLELALTAIINHHEVLKLQIHTTKNEGVKQHYFEQTVTAPVREIDATTLALAEQVDTLIDSECNPLHAKMNKENGVLMQVAIIRTPDFYQQDRLFITINHWVIDGVSWRIILDDLQRAIEGLRGEAKIKAFHKTTSFKFYSELMQSYANSPDCYKELDFWQKTLEQPAAELPRDFSLEVAYEDTLATAQSALAIDKTTALLEQCNSIYRTEINDLLLTALALTLHAWTDQGTFRISLEGHGRDVFDNRVDLAHTVGWFTSVYPVLLNVESPDDLASLIKDTKHRLRKIPNGGFGYSPLRYLNNQPSVRESLVYDNLIEFNYLGQFDNMNMLDVTLGLNILEENIGQPRAPENHRTNELEIDVIVVNQSMSIKVGYSSAHYRVQTMNNFVHHYIQSLEKIVEHCLNAQTSNYTPIDFPLAEVSQVDIDSIIMKNQVADQIETVYRLTALQEGMFYHSIHEPDSQAYIDQLHCEFVDEVDVTLFEKAWAAVIASHSIYRTTFLFDGLASPVQRVHKEVETPFEYCDLSDNSNALALFKQVIAEERSAGLDLAQTSLMRLKLLKLGGKHYGFIWTFHHALIDGWSLANTIETLLNTYKTLLESRTPILADDNYEDFIRLVDGYDIVAANKFWGDYLKGFDQPTKMTDDGSAFRGQQQPVEMATQSLSIDEALYQQIGLFSRQQHLTQNTLIQAAWALVIKLYSQQEDIVLGVTCSTRPATIEAVEEKVGLYINTLPLRVQFNDNDNVCDWLEKLQKNQLSLLDYPYSALSDIQQQCEVSNDQSLFNVLLVCENYPVGDVINREGVALRVSNIATPEHTNFPISLEAALDDVLSLKITYRKGLFSQRSVRQMLLHVKNALKELIAISNKKMRDICLIDAIETRNLVVERNTTRTVYPDICLHQLVEEQVALTPSNIALVTGERSLTYQQLNEISNGLALTLREKGVKPGDIIPVIADAGLSVPVSYLALMKCGAAFAPMDTRWPSKRLLEVVNNISPPIVMTTGGLGGIEWGDKALCVELDAITPIKENPVQPVDTQMPLFVIHTSGSTGVPKGAINTHRGIVNRLIFMNRYFGIATRDVILQTTHHCFDSSVWQYFWPLINGAKSVLAERETHFDIDHLLDVIHAQQVTVTDFTPAVLSSLYQHLRDYSDENKKLASLRALLVGGEALSLSVIKGFSQLQPNTRLVNCYGPTETSIGVIFYDIPAAIGPLLPIGKPIDNVEVYILDKSRSLVPAGVAGELYVGGNCVGLGYLGEPELTDEVFITNPFKANSEEMLYKTGDCVRYCEDGNIEFIGRLDDQVKIRGFRIELAEVEKAINHSAQIKSCCVLAREDSNGERCLVAFLTAVANDWNESVLRASLELLLPHYMVPNVFVVLDDLPLTDSGKVDKKALNAIEVGSNPSKNYVEPSDETEQQLADIFRAVLKLDKVGVHDNFFELGGHSLLATQVVSQARRQFNTDIKIKHIFQSPTVYGISKNLKNNTFSNEKTSITDFMEGIDAVDVTVSVKVVDP